MAVGASSGRTGLDWRQVPGSPLGAPCRTRLAQVSLRLLIVALSVSCAILAYWLGRPGAPVLILSWLPAAPAVGGDFWRGLANYLPDLVHPLVFILLSTLIVPSPAMLNRICLFWLALDALMEFGQFPEFAAAISASTHAWLADAPGQALLLRFFQAGTFDPLDLLAILGGCAGGYLAARATETRERGAV